MKHAAVWLVTLAAAVSAEVAGAQCEGGRCAGDNNGDSLVEVDELVRAVNVALTGCTEATCQDPFPVGLPASGQTTSYGAGSDGDLRAGAALSYTDNGDGTITDDNTGLMWEKKDWSHGTHDFRNRYTWGLTSEPWTMTGTMVTDFLRRLNTPPCFAGHCDWRIPNVKELQGIVNYQYSDAGRQPTVSREFRANCAENCAPATCSCTAREFYWSSTTNMDYPTGAWFVSFRSGEVGHASRSESYAVRAVRGGV
jgi:hypothetical protein